MHAHLVSVIKYRQQLFTSRHLEQIMPDVCAESGCEPAELNGEPGHVHLPLNFLPTAAISHLASSLKRVPSSRLRPEFPDLHRHYWQSAAAVVRVLLRRVGRWRTHLRPCQHIEQHERPA